MKIRLLGNIPVGRAHGLTAGRVLEANPIHHGMGRGSLRYEVVSNTGVPVHVLPQECEIVPEEAQDD